MKGFAERQSGCMRVRRFALVFKDQQLPFGRNSSDAVVGIVDILKGVQTAFQDLDNSPLRRRSFSAQWQLLIHKWRSRSATLVLNRQRSAQPFIEIARPSLPDDELRQGAACQARGS